jgi:acetyl esterase
MRVAVIVCAVVVVLAAAHALALELMRRRPQGKLDGMVALALRFARGVEAAQAGSVTEMRLAMARGARTFGGRLPPLPGIRDAAVPAGGFSVPIRIYTPEGSGPRPVLLFFHGGGFVEGSIETHENVCRHLARASGRIVVSTDYRLAPEHPFPAAIEDSYAVLQWASREAPAMGGIASDIAVAGDSAGATISAVLCLMARDRRGPPISAQVLAYPAANAAAFDTESYRHFGEGYMLDAKAMAAFTAMYLPDPADRANPYASPLLAADLSGLPPALVITAQFDVLRDEGRAYAERLRAAGVAVQYSCTPGVPHGYLSGARFLKKRTRESFALIAGFLAAVGAERA